MHKINTATSKAKRTLQQIVVLALLAIPLLSFIQVPAAEAAACPQKLVAIPHGKLCKFNGVVTCDKGYYAQYNGAGMVCGTNSTIPDPGKTTIAAAGDHCGGGAGNKSVATSINIGCRGKGNPIIDATFAIIRFLSTGVGIVIVGSTIYAGIQYTMSRGEPQLVATAINRLRANAWALLLFLFGYAILNYLIPGAFLK